MQILEYIEDHGSVILEDLFKALGLNKKTVGYHIKKLEEFGLLKTIPSDNNRIKLRTLSPLGQRILNQKRSESVHNEENPKVNTVLKSDINKKYMFEDMLTKANIFENREVLRSSYIPDYLPHRSKEIKHLATVLVSSIRGETPSNVLMYGKTGTGKTAVAKHVGKELERTGELHGVLCVVVYINCEVVDTQYRLLAYLARHFDKEIPMTGWPTDQVYNELKDAVDSDKRVVIIILDEIDKLVIKGDDVLYNLTRINSDLKKAKVSFIGITNDLTFTEYLDPRVKSSLGEEEIIFPPYDANQLRDILHQRAVLAFRQGVLEETVIPLCAAYAAQEHGDARRALDLLRVSGEIAERAKSSKILDVHVKFAQDKIESDRMVEVVRTLPSQSKLILLSVAFLSYNGNISTTTGEVYNVYKSMCKIIGIDLLTQRRVTDLISELDMMGILNATVVMKGRYGRTRAISICVPSDSCKKVLFEDYRLKPLENYKPTLDESREVRRTATLAIGSAFEYISDKRQAWDDLLLLTRDQNKDVSSYANYYLGKASIIKAAGTENKENFKKEIEKAIEFFEKSSKESVSINPASFCLPFYKSFYAMMFEMQESLSEVMKYLAEAKSVAKDSQSKQKLLEIIEKLANGLKEFKKMEIGSDPMKQDINYYRRYYEQAVDLLNAIKGMEPMATILGRGLLIINENINEIINEIQASKAVFKQKGEMEKYQALFRDPLGLEKSLNNLQILLSDICAKMPEEERQGISELLKKVKDESFIEDKINIINIILSKFKVNKRVAGDSFCEG